MYNISQIVGAIGTRLSKPCFC